MHISLLPIQLSVLRTDTTEISTVFFRAGYTSIDYPTSTHYAARLLFEKSRVIKCPSIAGGKKVQEVLTPHGILESLLLDPERGEKLFTQQDVDDVRSSSVGMWGLDADGDAGLEHARGQYMNLILKLQRGGGCNNISKFSIPSLLEILPASERPAWIAMELFQPPKPMGNRLVRAGRAAEGAVPSEVVSELGIFEWALFGGDGNKEA